MRKDLFSSRIGFILSTAGSAIGLGNIWKFPYIVGKFGGGTFLFVYFVCLLLAGLPTFLAEICIGKATGLKPQDAYTQLGRSRAWGYCGLITVWTGFFISSFYSVVAGWVLGYFFQSISGNLQGLHTTALAHGYFNSLMQSASFSTFFHFLFMAICAAFLLGGIKKGIERCNRLFMPLFFFLLFAIALWACTLPTASQVFAFMTTPQMNSFPRTMILVALGHAFFTLSVGQGTLVTYGSYLKSKENLLKNSLYILAADTLVSLLTAFSVISLVFYTNSDLTFGPGLVFETIPAIFSDIAYGHLLCPLFFALIVLAAITSQVSALEPLISHLQAKHHLPRKSAVYTVITASFLLGIPSCLSSNLFSDLHFFGENFLDCMNFISTSVLVPIGGLFAVLLVGRRWGISQLMTTLGGSGIARQSIAQYLTITLTYIAPVLIVIVFLHAIGWL